MATTIEIRDELRDRLKEQAADDGLILGEHLAHLAHGDDRRWRLQRQKCAIDVSNSADAESYVPETEDWERAELVDAL